jgi:FkbM family methyltransferase
MSDSQEIEKINLMGFIINIYKNDNCISETLKSGFFWDIDCLDLYTKYYIPNTDILDIGGYIGTSSLLFSKIIGTNNIIHTFEPVNYKCLQKNITDNNLNNKIKLYNCGLSNVNGKIKSPKINYHEKNNYGGISIAFLHDNPINEQLLNNDINSDDINSDDYINLKKLDDFDIKNVGLIKIDVEGFELSVLEGAIDTIKNNNYPPIFIEIWGVEHWRSNYRDYYIENANKIKSFLTNMNYKEIHIKGDDYLFYHE